MGSRITGFKFNVKGIYETLNSEGVKKSLKESGDRIAESMTSEGHGEFRAFEGDRGKRPHVFVNAYDKHAKNAANADPAIFARNIEGGSQ